MTYLETIYEVQAMMNPKLIGLGANMKNSRSSKFFHIHKDVSQEYKEFSVWNSTVRLNVNVKQNTKDNTRIELELTTKSCEFKPVHIQFDSINFQSHYFKILNTVKRLVKRIPTCEVNSFESQLRTSLAQDIAANRHIPVDAGKRDVRRFGYSSPSQFLITLAQLVDKEIITKLGWSRTIGPFGEDARLTVFICAPNFADALGYNSWNDFLEVWDWVTEGDDEVRMGVEEIGLLSHRSLVFK